MYWQNIYASMDEGSIKEKVRADGFDPLRINDPPGFVYHPHQHAETKLLAFLQGSMQVDVADETYHCRAGDKLIIPGNITHSAIVGKNGCVFFWSEKLM